MAYSGIHAAHPAVSSACRRALCGLTSLEGGAKAAPGVDAFLLRLYRPILFSALSAPNPAIRRNAGESLFACFPLQDPAHCAAEADALLAQQAAAFTALLSDDAPAVRCSAVAGVASCLDAYWELVTPAAAAGFARHIADEL